MLNNAIIGQQGCTNSNCHLVTENMWYGKFDYHTFVNNHNGNVTSSSKFFIRDDNPPPGSASLTMPSLNASSPGTINYSVGNSGNFGFEIPGWNPSPHYPDVEHKYNCYKNNGRFIMPRPNGARRP